MLVESLEKFYTYNFITVCESIRFLSVVSCSVAFFMDYSRLEPSKHLVHRLGLCSLCSGSFSQRSCVASLNCLYYPTLLVFVFSFRTLTSITDWQIVSVMDQMNVQTFLSLQKQTASQIWSAGYCLPTPILKCHIIFLFCSLFA